MAAPGSSATNGAAHSCAGPDEKITQPSSASSGPASQQAVPDESPQWERVLWRRQPFPDNYVPPSFLAELTARRECTGSLGI